MPASFSGSWSTTSCSSACISTPTTYSPSAWASSSAGASAYLLPLLLRRGTLGRRRFARPPHRVLAPRPVRLRLFRGLVDFARRQHPEILLQDEEPERALLGVMKPRVICEGEHRLLCSGFWGIARHVNYLGEILMATGLEPEPGPARPMGDLALSPLLRRPALPPRARRRAPMRDQIRRPLGGVRPPRSPEDHSGTILTHYPARRAALISPRL